MKQDQVPQSIQLIEEVALIIDSKSDAAINNLSKRATDQANSVRVFKFILTKSPYEDK